jgi:hypothetical protein
VGDAGAGAGRPDPLRVGSRGALPWRLPVSEDDAGVKPIGDPSSRGAGLRRSAPGVLNVEGCVLGARERRLIEVISRDWGRRTRGCCDGLP